MAFDMKKAYMSKIKNIKNHLRISLFTNFKP